MGGAEEGVVPPRSESVAEQRRISMSGSWSATNRTTDVCCDHTMTSRWRRWPRTLVQNWTDCPWYLHLDGDPKAFGQVVERFRESAPRTVADGAVHRRQRTALVSPHTPVVRRNVRSCIKTGTPS